MEYRIGQVVFMNTVGGIGEGEDRGP